MRRRAASQAVGSRSRRKETAIRMDGLRGDLKFAISSLRRSPAVAAAIVLCLSFDIGASTTVFSWMEGLVLRPLPAVKDVDRLVTIRWAAGSSGLAVSYPH